jgi:RNA polymerase sigma-70 factor (ECF subfamily)
VRAVAGGDRDALAELYDRHAPLMLPLAQKILRTRLDAEDLLHDVFVEVWRKAADYDEARGSVRSWLVLRVRSRALDRLRSPAYSRTISDANLEIAAPEADHETASAARVAETAMRKLPAEQQRVLDLLYFQGLTLSEMATLLDQPIGTLKSRLARALRSLREELVQEGALES